MTETLYPVRQRCKKCSKGFPNEGAILGLFCSYKCADMAKSETKPENAPRGCVTQREGKWQWKKRFKSEQAIPTKLKEDPSSNYYWCTTSCGFLHIGHSRVNLEVEKTRIVRDRAQLADILIKARGAATHREIGAKSGLQPIRIKELEDPKSKKVELDVLFKLIHFYRLKLSVVFS